MLHNLFRTLHMDKVNAYIFARLESKALAELEKMKR